MQSDRLEAVLAYSKTRAQKLGPRRRRGQSRRHYGDLPSHLKPCVYILQCADFIKIGYGLDPWKRIDGLQTGNPLPIVLLGVIPSWTPHKIEAELHREFKPYLVRGEWFKLPPDKLKTLTDRALKNFEGRKMPV